VRGGIALRLFCPAFAFVLLGCHRSSGPALEEISIALPNDAINWHPVRLAQSRGYAAEEGVTFTISEAAGMSKGMEALVGGSVDITAGQLAQAIQVAAEGREVRCFLSLHSRPSLALAVAPAMADKIRTIRDLKGRRVGVSSPGSPTHQFVNFLLVSDGLTPSDVSVVSVGTGATSIAALEHGKVDAGVLVGSGVTMFERGHSQVPFLADPRTEEGARRIFGVATFPATSLIARDDWLRAKPDTARRFVRAVKKAMLWIRSHSPEEVRATIPEALRMPDVEADLQAIRQSQQTLTPSGMIPADAPPVVLKFVALSSERVRDAHLDVSRVYTNEFASGE
jgi:NitT/TauT family transport system substrate-binding protein